MEHVSYYHSPIGLLKIISEDDYLTSIQFVKGSIDEKLLSLSELIGFNKEVVNQLEDYFRGKRKQFDISFNPTGTDFQKKVWKILCEIPYGQTQSYKEIAIAINQPNASRAIGNANNKNPIPIVVPCHRVIGSNGQLVGYAGGLGIKRYLLSLERAGALPNNLF